MHKIEIDVTKPAQLRAATDFAVKHKCPALVVNPDLVTAALIGRGMTRGRYKVITGVDWPKGLQYHSDKFRGFPSESLKCDGFEILLTPRDKLGIQHEVRYLSKFFRDYVPPTAELRFVLGIHNPGRTMDHMIDMIHALAVIPNFAVLRTTHLTKIVSARSTIDAHNAILSEIKAVKPFPIKISGNINMKIRIGCDAHRYACSVEQAQALFSELSDNGLKKLEATVKDQMAIEPNESDESASEENSDV